MEDPATAPNPDSGPGECSPIDGLAASELAALLPDAVVIADESGEIVHANSKAEDLFGYTAGALEGVRVEALVPEQLRELHRTHRAGYLEDPRERPMGTGLPLLARRSDGTTFPAEISLSATQNGRALVFAAIRDATARIEAEREWRALEGFAEEGRRQQMLRIESLGQLAGGIAHDFNNILASVLMSADLALGKGGLGADEALREIRDAASRASQLTRQLLALSRDAPENPERVVLGKVVNGLLELLRRTLGESVSVERRIGDDEGEVLIDRSQLERVLLNLAINARDAMPEGGVLTISTRIVEVDAAFARARPGMEPGDHVLLVVEDTGFGMTPDQIQRAFEPFYTTKEEGEGTGLGLATAYSVVRKARGFIGIDSTPGQGTAVKIYLPTLAAADGEAGEPGSDDRMPSERSVRAERVMVIEDRDDLRELVGRLLEANGYEVSAAEGGPAALELLGRKRAEIDAVVCDIVASGTELAGRIAECAGELPVVYLSARMSQLAAAGAHGSGIPFDGEELLRRLRRRLESTRP